MLLGVNIRIGSVTTIGFISLCAATLFFIPDIIGSIREQQTRAQKRQADIMAQLDQLIQKHAQALSIKRLQKRRLDDYGNITDDEWTDEKEYFCQKVIRPAFPQLCNWSILDRYTRAPRTPLNARGPGLLDAVFLKKSELKKARTEAAIAREALYALNTRESLYRRIDARIDVYSASNPILIVTRDFSTLTPTAFEAYCAEILKVNGWDATTTQASGDQGVDILATRHGRKAVFQCKLYSSPVGNDAVQEAISGKAWASADSAYVVSNADFTPSAKALAAKVGVRLLHYSMLKNLDS
jgi:restriction system protein